MVYGTGVVDLAKNKRSGNVDSGDASPGSLFVMEEELTATSRNTVRELP